MVPSPYIPAWRRLGLKLKSEEHTASNYSQTPIALPEPSPKKRKLEASKASSNSSSPNIEAAPAPKKAKPATPIAGFSSPLSKPSSPSQPRRKSVSFAPNTKFEPTDGLSTKRLVQKAELSRLARLSGAEEVNIEAATQELNDIPWSANGTPKVTKKQKQKPEGVKKTQSTSDTNGDSKAEAGGKQGGRKGILDYLDAYYKDRERWKFNKNTQTTVLKCALDIDRIPTSYNDVLRAYIAGLRGDGVRHKLHTDAQDVVRDESPEASADAALVDDEENGNKVKAKMDRVERAKLVRQAVEESYSLFPPAKQSEKKKGGEGEEEGGGTEGVNEVRKGLVNGAGTRMKSARPRKRRKRVESSSSSSSSSSSDSSTSEDNSEDEGKDKEGNRKKTNVGRTVNGTAQKYAWEEDSSSSNSDGDSGSRSDGSNSS